MVYNGGYQSTLRLSDVALDGSIPANHLVGGFGTTTGSPDVYQVALDPPITELVNGLTLMVRFHAENDFEAHLNVDGLGALPLVVPSVSGVYVVEEATLKTDRPYLIVLVENQWYIRPETIFEPYATTDDPGLIRIATPEETQAGTSENKAITPSTLKAYLGEVLTGRWTDKGPLDAALNPNYPPGVRGEAYVISRSGWLGDNPTGSGVQVQALDVLYCTQDNPGGTQHEVGDAWIVIEGNKDLATQAMAGLITLASSPEVQAGLDRQKAITPGTLADHLNNWPPTDTEVGVTRLATVAEVTWTFDGDGIVTPGLLGAFMDQTFLGRAEANFINANPNEPLDYPAGKRGDVYLVFGTGYMAGELARKVNQFDLLLCWRDSPGGGIAARNDWTIIKSNISDASKTQVGVVGMATEAEVDAGSDVDKAVNPAQLKAAISGVGGGAFSEVNFVTPDSTRHPDINFMGASFTALNLELIYARRYRVAPKSTLSFPYSTNASTVYLNLPIPKNPSALQVYNTISSEGNVFEVTMNSSGQVYLKGQFTSSVDWVDIRPSPYLANHPFTYEAPLQ